MFEVDKPRQFHYQPRFYDPEKEKWEAVKKKYALAKEREQAEEEMKEATENGATEDDLAYFEQKLRNLDRQKRLQESRLTWSDMFRKREMPKFEYTPRFSSTPEPSGEGESAEGTEETDTLVKKYTPHKHQIRIHRRYDFTNPDELKRVPTTKIIIYLAIIGLLLAAIYLM